MNSIMVKSKNTFSTLGLILLIITVYFETIIVGISQILYVLGLFFSILLVLYGNLRNGKLRYSKKLPVYFVVWLSLIPFFVYGMVMNERMVSIRIVLYLFWTFVIGTDTCWIQSVDRILLFFGGISMLATFVFYFFPQAYSVMVNLYGYYPPGTGRLEYGYRAGVFAHYSHNALSIAVFVILMVCHYSAKEKNKCSKGMEYSMSALVGLVTLMFTGKRGTLIWCALAVTAVVFINSKKKASITWRITLYVVAVIIALIALRERVPQIQHLIERFTNLGNDKGSSERFAMWNLALNSFCLSPVWGIGFQNFRGMYELNLAGHFESEINMESYRRLDAHNVYLQMLCETGILGALIYVTALVLLLSSTIKLVRYYKKREYYLRLGVLFSFGIQVFYLLYSLSGNCLYDMTFCFYALGMAITYSLYNQMRRERSRKL